MVLEFYKFSLHWKNNCANPQYGRVAAFLYEGVS